MSPLKESHYLHNRRDILKASTVALLPLALSATSYASQDQKLMTANGGTDPYPIPWLDKFGSHNQAAGLNNEPGHIYHFRGRWSAAIASQAWAPTIKETASRSALLQRTTASWRENIGPRERRSMALLSIYDTRCFGDRWPPRTKSMIFTRPLPNLDFSGWCLYRRAA